MNMRAFSVALLLPSLLLGQQGKGDKGSWKPVSKTANAITGSIMLTEERLMINFAAFTVAPIRHVEPAEVSSVLDLPADSNPGGELYRLEIPAQRTFLHKNTICGTEDTTYMLTAVDGKALQVAFFSGAKMPDLKPETIATSTTVCGTFTYSR